MGMHFSCNVSSEIFEKKLFLQCDMPRPIYIEGVQRFNGFANYSAKFLPKLTEPIRHLTRKDVP